MTIVKICGVRRAEDAAAAVAAGADMIGVVLWAPSPRCASEEQARAVREAVPAGSRWSACSSTSGPSAWTS
jgi:phosphoribosylanthranilate isomerase